MTNIIVKQQQKDENNILRIKTHIKLQLVYEESERLCLMTIIQEQKNLYFRVCPQ